MAGNRLPPALLCEAGLDRAADLHGVRATRMKAASRRHVDRAGRVSLNGCLRVAGCRVELRNRTNQGHCVGMERFGKDVVGSLNFDNLA